MIIDQSVTIEPGEYFFDMEADTNLENPVITVKGSNIKVDFSGVTLRGSTEPGRPDLFKGLAVFIEDSKGVTLHNLCVQGFKVALLAENSDSLSVIDCDFSYNYRQRLFSTRKREILSDWLYYHHNEHDEWLRYGAAVYLKSCHYVTIKGLKATQGQNGLMLVDCHHGIFVYNEIRFNSGVGIGLYRSSDNKILYNKLDWNVRGYSHGKYQRGQDSAGILVYEQSSRNVFAYNSVTHSGDGFFLWAGQQTMDNGTGGCNNNLIYKNDFSYAPTNGVEATFSSNRIVGNKMKECRYGVWAGYSYQTEIKENEIDNCEFGIAIEHGNRILIDDNELRDCSTGIRLWERDDQPPDWGFSHNRDISSRQYIISNNVFKSIPNPLQITNTEIIHLSGNKPENLDSQLVNTLNSKFALDLPPKSQDIPKPPPDSLSVFLKDQDFQGRKYILLDEWGPYNFEYPAVWLRRISENEYIFALFGPQGNWRFIDANGFIKGNPQTGSIPSTFVATIDEDARLLWLEFEFIGEEHLDPFGRIVPRGSPVRFSFRQFEPRIDWDVLYYNYEPDSLPVENYDAFKELIATSKPVYRIETEELAYTWWGKPAPEVNSGKFVVLAKGHGQFDSGVYKIYITSDDGVRMWVNGESVLERWNFHDPVTDSTTLSLEGKVEFLIEYFNGGGLGNLDFIMDIQNVHSK